MIVSALLLLPFVAGHSLPHVVRQTSAPIPPNFPLKNIQHTVQLLPDTWMLYGFDEKDGKPDENGMAYFGLVGKNQGWNALGISDNGAMTGADIVVCRSDAGKMVIEDRHATGFNLPKLDVGQDVNTLFTYQQNNLTACLWSRKVKADCLVEDLDIPMDKNAWIIHAHGEDNTFDYHGPENRIAKEIFLPDPERKAGDLADTPPLPSDAKTLDLYISPSGKGVEILQTEQTMYCYTLHALPDDTKYHVVREEPLISNSHAHHLILYSCSEAEYQKAVSMIPPGTSRCIRFSNSTESRSSVNPCTGFWTGWASGGVATDLPATVGRPMGQGPHSARHVMMEMHYDNKAGVPNFYDNAGWRLIYTRQLRQHDMGVMTLGILTQQLKIPPGEKNLTFTSVCPSVCTNLLNESITIFSNGFHMHDLGRSAVTKVIRAGQEIPEMGRVDYFDNKYQAFQGVTPRIVEPGDTLITTFSFNSEGRKNVTVGGLSTQDEMAFNFISYYPAQNVGYCITTANNIKLAICPPAGGLDANNVGQNITGGITNWLQAAKVPTYTPLPGRTQVCPASLMGNNTVIVPNSFGFKVKVGLVMMLLSLL